MTHLKPLFGIVMVLETTVYMYQNITLTDIEFWNLAAVSV